MQKKNLKNNQQKGFTLIEMLIAISLFSIIAIAGYSSLSSFNKTSKNLQNSMKNLEALQTLVVFLDRDFSQVFNQEIKFNQKELVITSIQNDSFLDIYYNFDGDKIIRKESDGELVLIENISKITTELLDNNNKWHKNWKKVKGKYIKVIRIKFDSVFGKITKMVLINE